MRKVTKRLLTVGVAFLALGACQDSVTVVQPPPPPPPPPAAAIDATVSILGLDLIPGPGSVNPTAVFGDINVSLNIEEGDNTVTGIDLLFDGTAVGCQTIQTNQVPGQAVSLSATGGADVVECFWNTDDAAGVCDGSNLAPQFGNGTHTLGAQITLSDGTTRTASNAQQVTLVNGSFIAVTLLSEANGGEIGSNGRLYHGGGDMTFAGCPISFNGTVVGTLSMFASDNGGAVTSCDADQGGGTYGACGSADLGSGAGATHTDSAEPFVFTLSQADNDAFDSGTGDDGTGVEDTGTGTGHSFTTTGNILDADGLNVSSEFTHGTVSGLYIDQVAPRVNCNAACAAFTASTITIDPGAGGQVPTTLTWYADGTFGLSNVQEEGAGWSFSAGGSMDIGDCSDTDNSDAADATAFDPLFTGVSGIADVTEEDWELGGDGFAGTDSGDDCLLGELRTLADDLGNATRLDDTGSIPAQIQTATAFGKDATPADLTNPMPDATILVLNPDANADGMTCADLAAPDFDCQLLFDLFDPDLASGDPGSGVNETGCSPCSNVAAEIDDGPGTTNDGESLNIGNFGTTTGVDEDFLVSLTAGSGTFPLADGDYVIEVTGEDNATDPNETVHTFMFTLDDTPPGFGALNPAPIGSAGTDADAIVMVIGGTISDANIIDDAELEVFVDGTDNIGTGADGVCDAATDTKLSVSGGDIDRNDIDHENGTSSIAFNEAFTINQPDTAARTLNYCFIHKATDEAVLLDGTDTGNTSSLTTKVVVIWNAG